jgi:hypothetical protein
MAKYPKAKIKLLAENATQPKIKPIQFIVHTAVDAKGPTDLYNYFHSSGVGVESHFWLPWSGEVTQFMDTEVKAEANYKGNDFAISCETEDDGDPEGNPWNDKQIDGLIDLGRWCSNQHSIPTVLCPRWNAPGFGWHAMWGFRDPIRQIGPIASPWTPSLGKTCPGKARIWQYRTKVLPAIFGVTQSPEKPTTAMYDQGTIDEIVRRLTTK